MPPTKRWAPIEPQPRSAAPRDKTVKRAVARPGRPRRPARVVVVAHNYDDVSAIIAERVATDRRADLGQAAPAGGPSRRLRRARRATCAGRWPRPRRSGACDHHRGRRPGVWAPGDVLVFDWGEIGPLFVFCAVLAWSRFRFVYFADNLGARVDHGGVGRVHGDHRRRCPRPSSPIAWAA